jgi:two-component sensor histidine kinase
MSSFEDAAASGRRAANGAARGRGAEPATLIVAALLGALSTLAACAAMRLHSQSDLLIVAVGSTLLALAGVVSMLIITSLADRRAAGQRSAERSLAERSLRELDSRLSETAQEAAAGQRRAAAEREVLLREVYHRVKNNLQIIQSLLRLGARGLDERAREPFDAAVRRIGAMARVHTLVYASEDFTSIDLKDYLEGLMAEIGEGLQADERGIAVEVEVERLRVPLDTAVPLAFIAVELATNALKHAFPPGRSGRIRVSARRQDGHGHLAIDDNGTGVEDPSRRALGLTIVERLCQQIGATFTPPEKGSSRFAIAFPLPPPAPGPVS